MRQVTVHINSTLPHFSQLLAGLDYLEEKNYLKLKYCLNKFQYPPYIFRVDFDNLVLFFDLADNSEIHDPTYEQCDFYIKRMLRKADWEKRKKLLPYGLNYQVYYRNSFLKTLFLKDRHFLKYSLRYSGLASSVLNMKNSISTNRMADDSAIPSQGKNIVYRARLWDPDSTEDPVKKEERSKMNSHRIELNRALKKKYGQFFFGGIEGNSFSADMCPDLLLSEREYHKKNFLGILNNSSIGIATPGLERSIGFRFPEYISRGLTVVSTPVDPYKLLGPLEKDVHYLEFRNNEECLEKIELLFSNDWRRKQMQLANRDYYENWLHPGAKTKKILELVENA